MSTPASFLDIDKALEQSVCQFSRCNCRERIFLNSHPKSGTMLMRNILLHFLGLQRDPNFIWPTSLASRLESPETERLLVGHVPFTAKPVELKGVDCMLLLVRDPAEVLLSLARSRFDPRLETPESVDRQEAYSIEECMAQMVEGYDAKGPGLPFQESYMSYAGWLQRGNVKVVFFDQLSNNDYVKDVLKAIRVALPDNIDARVEAGRSQEVSATFISASAEYARLLDCSRTLLVRQAPLAIRWFDSIKTTSVGTVVT